jgi:DNA-binding transcriptional ArsR family regulator
MGNEGKREDIRVLERILKALANRRRLGVIKFIHESKSKEAHVGEIAEHIGLSFKSTSRHLSILTAAEILIHEQKGLYVYYQLNPVQPQAAQRVLPLL